MASMDDMLNMPFDQLWSNTQPSRPPPRPRPVQFGTLPSIDHEAVHALGGLGAYESVAPPVSNGMAYQELVHLDENRVRRGVMPRVLRRLPSLVFKGSDEGQCHICMESFNEKSHARELPCKHVFCTQCIFQWLADHDTCPTCRWKYPEEETRLLNIAE
ncbi:hypothetical protein BSKO_05561 [Bryopsis sp. KO-2023]|nr:hypothetical protein BSKO_05561 [Bryopsis sp. KO-2023]